MSLAEGPKPELSLIKEEKDEDVAPASPASSPPPLLAPPDNSTPIPRVVRVSFDLSENDMDGAAGDYLDDIIDEDYVSMADLQHQGSEHHQVDSRDMGNASYIPEVEKFPRLKQPMRIESPSPPLQSTDTQESEQKESVSTETSIMSPHMPTDWTWDSVKNWWNSSSVEACGKAERDLIAAYLDPTIYEYEQQQIVIDYDPEPVSVKQKKLKRAKTTWFENLSIDFGTDSNHSNDSKGDKGISQNSQYTDLGKLSRTQSDGNIKDLEPEMTANNENDEIYIHTLTFRVKVDRLSELIYRLQNGNIANSGSDDDTVRPMDPNFDIDILSDVPSNGTIESIEECTSNLKDLRSEIAEIHKSHDGPLRRHKIPPIVIGHGYGMAGGILIPSIQSIFESLLSAMALDKSPVIYVIDWLGNGMSSRPEFQCETRKEAEDWFVESLEAWREAMDIEKMILCGHSLGGYCSTVYAMRYPQHVEHLIGISPAGIPDEEWATSPKASWGTKAGYYIFGNLLWNSKLTIFDMVRAAGPNGKNVVQQMIEGRYKHISANDRLKPLLVEYFYQIMAMLPASGEFATNVILGPGARAYYPLERRIGYLKQFQKAVIGYDFTVKQNESLSQNALSKLIKVMESPDPEQDAAAKDCIQRLKHLRTLSDNQMISAQEYELRKTQIIDELTGTNLQREDEEKMEFEPQDGNETTGETESDNESEIDADAALNDNLKIDFIYGDSDWMVPTHAIKLKHSGVVKCNVYINKHCGHQLILENRKGFGRLLGGIIAKGQMTQIDDDKGHRLEDSMGVNNPEIFF